VSVTVRSGVSVTWAALVPAESPQTAINCHYNEDMETTGKNTNTTVLRWVTGCGRAFGTAGANVRARQGAALRLTLPLLAFLLPASGSLYADLPVLLLLRTVVPHCCLTLRVPSASPLLPHVTMRLLPVA